jgi:hypothetical protein
MKKKLNPYHSLLSSAQGFIHLEFIGLPVLINLSFHSWAIIRAGRTFTLLQQHVFKVALIVERSLMVWI